MRNLQGLRALKQKFRRVFFIPGNHDLWIRPGIEDKEYPDSICKLMAMMNVFDEIGVEMGPAEVAKGLYVVPLYSWYNSVGVHSIPAYVGIMLSMQNTTVGVQ